MNFFNKKLIRMSSNSLGTTSVHLKECGPIRLVGLYSNCAKTLILTIYYMHRESNSGRSM